jgi:uncharacterized protein YjiS (DUF1127 family)
MLAMRLPRTADRQEMQMNTDRVDGGVFNYSRRTETGSSLWSLADAALASVATTLLDWLERARQRRELGDLSDGDLHDFGASRCDAAREGSKPFWQP